MSLFHSESENRPLRLTVKVKFLDLNRALGPAELSALLAPGGKRQLEVAGNEKMSERTASSCELSPETGVQARMETCFAGNDSVAATQFEEHIETCEVCASRVELQLDFMECLETAIYQRLSDPKSRKVHGALMVSAPESNFAICGELDIC